MGMRRCNGCLGCCGRHGAGNRCHERFVHQEMAGLTPLITAKGVLIFMLLATAVCIALGVPILIASLGVVEVKQRYDNAGSLAGLSNPDASQALIATSGAGLSQAVAVTIPKNMMPPIYVYYELKSFFQNHKRFVRSVVSKQAGGTNYSASSLNQCNPEIYEGRTPNASKPQNGVISPCGLIAWSLFNDTFAATQGTTPLNIDTQDISWAYDREHLYGNYQAQNFNDDPRFRGGGALTQNVSQSENLLVWMKPAAYHTFRKLYGRIDQPLLAGSNVTFQIQNRYNTYGFSGQKAIVLSTLSWVGGKNNVLGIVFIVVGALCFLTAIVFFCCYYLNSKRRKFGDEMQLSWNKPAAQKLLRRQ